MKKNNVRKGIFTALLLASPFVTAGVKYPAADFQPKVVYQDKDYQHKGSSSATSSESFGDTTKADANYPAAAFEPEVLYHDKGYQHSASIEKAKSIPLAMWEEKVEEVAAASESAASSEESSVNPLFAIVILAVAAFLFRQKSSGSGAVKKSKQAKAVSSGGLTGVAKYLKSKSPRLSGVARYLEENQSTPKSSVAKYVAKKVVAAKKAAAENVSSVEKYVRRQS